MNEHDFPEGCKERQRIAILRALVEHGPLNSVVLRESLGVINVATRIFELRRDGYRISTKMVWATDEQGRRHKCAEYSLLFGGGQ